MAGNFPIAKRSSSLSEIAVDDVIYDVISSDEESSLTRGASLPSSKRVRVPPKLIRNNYLSKPDIQKSDPSLNKIPEFENRELELSELVDETIVKLPVVVEVVVGSYGEEEGCTFGNGEKYLLCYKTETTYVSCANSEGNVFNIPVTSRYEVALVNLEHESVNKTNVTVKHIMAMKRQPSRILANSAFEINRINIAQNQILELVRTGCTTVVRDYLKVQTLSGEEFNLPMTSQNTFSCSIKTISEPLPNAIETCIIPQRVILTDTASTQVVKKQICTLVKCYMKKSFLARIYTNEHSSIPTEDSLIEVPVELKIIVKVVGKPKDTSLIHEMLKYQAKKGTNEIKAKAQAKIPPPKCEKPFPRSRSTTDVHRISKFPMPTESSGPSTPPPEKKLFFTPSEQPISKPLRPPLPEKPIPISPPEKPITKPGSPSKQPVYKPTSPAKKPITPKPMEITKSLKSIPVSPSVESILKAGTPSRSSFYAGILGGKREFQSPESKRKSTLVETCNKKQHKTLETDIKSLEETNKELETKLAKEKELNRSLEKKVASLEKSLEEANASISSNETTIRNLLLAKRQLPSIPNQPGSAPTSPFLQHKTDFSPVTWNKTPPSPPLKPNKQLSQPYYQKPRDLLDSPTNSEPGQVVQGTSTVEDMGSILDRINLSQYKDVFKQEGINIEILCTLSEEFLERTLKIKNALHRKKLLKLAEKAKNNEDISNFYVEPEVLIGKNNESLYQVLK